MGFVSFVGRVLFVAAFLLSAYQEFNEFGTDGGPAAKALKPKFNVFVKNISSHLGVAVPHVELLYLAFITPIVHDFYNYDMEKAEFAQIFGKFTQDLALIGALLFFLGMKNSIPKRQAKKKAPKAKTN